MEIGEFYKRLDREIKRLGWKEKVMGSVDCWPILLISNKTNYKKSLLVIAGLHGDEIGGPLGILNFLENLKEDLAVNLSIVPIANPIGFSKRQRGNKKGADINRNYGDKTEVEEKIILENNIELLANAGREGILTLHEDVDMEKFYMYSYEKENESETIYPGFLRVGERNFGLFDEGEVLDLEGKPNGEKVFGGIVFAENDDTLETFLKTKVNHAKVITTETPAKMNLGLRVKANRELIECFVNYGQCQDIIGKPMEGGQDGNALVSKTSSSNG